MTWVCPACRPRRRPSSGRHSRCAALHALARPPGSRLCRHACASCGEAGPMSCMVATSDRKLALHVRFRLRSALRRRCPQAAAPRVTAAPDALPHAHVPQQAAPATPAATPAAAAAAGATPAAAGATPAAAGATPVTTPATAQQQAQQQARARRCLGRRTCLSAAVRALVAGRAHARQLLRTSLSLSPSCPSGTRYPHARCPRLLLLPTTRPRLFVQRPAHMTGFCLKGGGGGGGGEKETLQTRG